MSFQANKENVQKHRNIKICCDLNDLSAQPIDEICLFSQYDCFQHTMKRLNAKLKITQ